MKTKKSGAIAAYCLLTGGLVLLAGLSAAGYSGHSMLRATNDANAAVAFEATQATLDLAIADVQLDMQTNKQITKFSYNLSDTIGTIAPGSVATVAVVQSADKSYAWVTASNTYKGLTKSLRVMVKPDNVDIWNNAIFAGAAAAGGAINGNVDVRGSVHILGDGHPFTDTNGNGKWDVGEPYQGVLGTGSHVDPLGSSSVAAGLSGTAYIGNNYVSVPSAITSIVPAPPTVNGYSTLNTEVRVKQGQLSLSGTADIGATAGSIQGIGPTKDTIDGSYVTNGYTGNKGAGNVFSDNGTNNPYDLGSYGITFPYINGIGAKQYTDSGGSNWSNQQTYLGSRSLWVPVTTIKSTTAAFSYGPDQYGNSISFTPASGSNPAVLTTNGIIAFNGPLQIGAKDTINFQGIGTIYSNQDINIDGNVVPVSGKLFPTGTTLGFIATRNINLAAGNGSSQLTLAGAFYAQGKIYSAKQNQIAGTFVSNYFDMGSNVPSIYEVPSLIQNMPPGMPGDKSVYVMRRVGWRERK